MARACFKFLDLGCRLILLSRCKKVTHFLIKQICIFIVYLTIIICVRATVPQNVHVFQGQIVELGNYNRLCRVSRTNNYTFFYPASMVWRFKIKIGCPTFAVKVEFVKKRAPQNVHYSCHASKKSKPRTIYLFSSLLFVLSKKGSKLVKNVNSYTEGT